jgi:hypothetical protein
MPEETALIGWKEIARFLGWSLSKAKSRRKEWADYGVIFYTLRGRPPNRHKVVCAFPSILQRLTILKSSKGELL